MRKINFSTVMGFLRLVQQQGLASWNVNIPCHNFLVDFCFFLPSILYLFTFSFFLFSSCSINHSLKYIICLLWLNILSYVVFVEYLNACDDRPFIQLSCSVYIHSYNGLLKKGMIWCKKTPHFILHLSTPITSKILLLKEKCMLLHCYVHIYADFFNNYFIRKHLIK